MKVDLSESGVRIFKVFGNIVRIGTWVDEYDPIRNWVPNGIKLLNESRRTCDLNVYVRLVEEVLKKLKAGSELMPDRGRSMRVAMYNTRVKSQPFSLLSFGIPDGEGIPFPSFRKVRDVVLRMMIEEGIGLYVFYHNAFGQKLVVELSGEVCKKVLRELEREVVSDVAGVYRA